LEFPGPSKRGAAKREMRITSFFQPKCVAESSGNKWWNGDTARVPGRRAGRTPANFSIWGGAKDKNGEGYGMSRAGE